MKYNLDELLKRALTPKEEPGEALNRKILDQVKEEGSMKNRSFCRMAVQKRFPGGGRAGRGRSAAGI